MVSVSVSRLGRIVALVMLGTWLGLASPMPAAAAGVGKVVILSSGRSSPYESAREGFETTLHERRAGTDIEVVYLEGDPGRHESRMRNIAEARPALIFGIGSSAGGAATDHLGHVPLVVTLALRTTFQGGSSPVTGVYMEHSLPVQFEWMKRFVPALRNVGVIYDRRENSPVVDEAAQVAPGMGLSLVAVGIDSPKEIPSALKHLSRNADVLWGIPDRLVLSSSTARHIMLFSFRNRIPFVGLSASWTKSGALYALERDYRDIGAQCGEMAIAILDGASPGAVPPQPPRKVLYSVNRKAAKHLKIDIPEELLRDAQVLY